MSGMRKLVSGWNGYERQIAEDVIGASIGASSSWRSIPTIFALIAEPGMGKSTSLRAILDKAEDEGYSSYTLRLDGCEPDAAARKVVDLSRQVVRAHGKGEKIAVAIDDVPPSDESIVRRISRAILRMADVDALVCFSALPENLQLAEALPDCRLLTSMDLCSREERMLRVRDPTFPIVRLTHGIPSLVRSLGGMEATRSGEGTVIPSAYYTVLSKLVVESFRPTLIEDELRVRLAMFLMAGGSFDEVAHCCECARANEVLEGMAESAPIFGVNITAHAFVCAGVFSPESFSACSDALGEQLRRFPRVGLRAAAILAERGIFWRAGAICELMETTAADELVLKFGPEMLNVGRIGLVQRALENPLAIEYAPVARRVSLGMAITALSSRLYEVGSEGIPADVGTDDPCVRNALMLVRARRMLAGRTSPLERGEMRRGRMYDEMRMHLGVSRQLAFGSVKEAFGSLVSYCPPMPDSVSSALLVVDYELSRLLLCEPRVVEEVALARASRILGNAEGSAFASLVLAASAVRAVLTATQDEDYAQVEGLCSGIDLGTDFIPHAVALLAGSLADLRLGGATRALVRARLVRERGALAPYLRDVASLIEKVSLHLSGESVSWEDVVGCVDVTENPDLSAVAAVLAAAIADESRIPARMSFVDPMWERVPRSALWLLVALSFGIEPLSGRLLEVMPLAWRKAVLASKGNLAGATEPTEARERVAVRVESGPPVRVNFLGGFTVVVKGRELPIAKLERRSAKAMLEYVLLSPAQTARRFSIIEQVWPDCDYVTGLARVYQATACIRALVRGTGCTADPFVSNRSARSLSANTEVFSCDVFDFQDAMGRLLNSGDQEEVVRLGYEVDNLYEGDLYLPEADASGYLTAFREELRRGYVDAMVVAADAAYSLGRYKSASHFAERAIIWDSLREDALIVLLRALRASGRSLEAERRYRAYTESVVKHAGRPPSRLLRLAAGEETGHDAGLLPMRCEDAVIGE